jgi:hypothetical protein
LRLAGLLDEPGRNSHTLIYAISTNSERAQEQNHVPQRKHVTEGSVTWQVAGHCLASQLRNARAIGGTGVVRKT